MDPISRLIDARRIIFQALQKEIINTELDTSIYQLKILFSQGSILYIRYNKYNEYAYQIIFSKHKGDWVRYDNFDDRWHVSTKPHHFHPRYNNPTVESPMIGDPENDMPKLIEYLKKALFFRS
ncbi:MAG: toxin-antitoxin system TumE family protein [Candidatus Helarchaeota archaeon]